MKPSANATDASLLQNIILGTRQTTQKLEGVFRATVVITSGGVITFTLDGYSTRAGFTVALPSGWSTLTQGTGLLVAFVSTSTGATDIWAIAHR